jgi:outer membrane protein OmpA-like peptidoglycan-associated protein
MKNYPLLTAALMMISFAGFAQRSPDFCKKFEAANYHLDYNNFGEAVPAFEELVQMEPTNALLNYNLGFCILNAGTRLKSDAIPYLEMAEKNMLRMATNYDDSDCNEKRAPLSTLLNLGEAYMFAGKFDMAIDKFETYRKLEKRIDKETAEILDRQVGMCRFADESMKKPVKVDFTNLGSSVNTKFPEYFAGLTDDESIIYFTSRREGNGNFQAMDGKFFESIFTSTSGDNGFGASDEIGSPINVEENDVIFSISADGTKMLIGMDKKENGNIYMSELKGDSWTEPMDVGPNINTKFKEKGACISADGTTLYFASDRKGSLGGFDLYKSTRQGNSWGPAEALASLNTKFDEMYPTLSLDGKTLFFSSSGHETMGGLDIMKSENNGGTWGAPANLGYPINTVDDDFGYFESIDGMRAYVSQIRKGGMGDLDIYKVTYQDRKPKAITVYMGRVVLNNGVKELTSTNKITVKAADGSEKIYKAASNGKFSFNLKPGSKYSIKMEANGKEFAKDEIDIPAGSPYQEIKKEFNIDPEVAVKAAAEKAAEEKAKAEEVAMNAKAKPIGFKMYFQYNKKDIGASNDFKDFMKAFQKAISESGKVQVKIEASASKVPTRKYKDNQNLSKLRADAAIQKLKDEMVKLKLDPSKVVFLPTVPLVGGPEYKNDFNENRKSYEEYQYIDISVTK